MESTPSIVLDSSIAVKWFSKEVDSDKAMILLKRFQSSEISICVVEYLFLEVANALRYKPLSDPNFLGKAIRLLYNLKLVSYPLTMPLIKKSSEISFDANISLYDAVPVALAEELGTYCITADRKTKYEKLIPKHYPVRLLEWVD
jgi:predicted nucleic acid-binding protein